MARHPSLRILLHFVTLLACTESAWGLAAPDTDAGLKESDERGADRQERTRVAPAIESRLEGDGSLRSRLSLELASGAGPLEAFVEESLVDGALGQPLFGLSTPSFDLGSLREEGLPHELASPLGIGSMRNHSAVRLDRSAETMRAPGAVIRFGRQERPGVELYAMQRGGLAPAGTATAGGELHVAAAHWLDLVAAAKATALGAEEGEEAWFLERPAVRPGSVAHAGTRLELHARGFAGSLSGGASLCDRLNPSGYLSGSLAYTGGFRFASAEGRRLSLSARIDGGLAGPDYLCEDGRFVLKTALLHPVLAVRLPGLSFQASYTYSLYRLPLVPVANRRSVHAGSLSAHVVFGPFGVGSFYRPRLEYSEEGKTLLRQSSGLTASLSLGAVTVTGELDLQHSNYAEDEADGGLDVAWDGVWGRVSVGVATEGGAVALEGRLLLARIVGRLEAGVATGPLFELRRGRVSSAGGWRLGGGELTLSWRSP